MIKLTNNNPNNLTIKGHDEENRISFGNINVQQGHYDYLNQFYNEHYD